MNLYLEFSQYLSLEKKYSQNTIQAYATDLNSFQEYLNNYHESISPVNCPYVLIRNWIVFLLDKKQNSKSINRRISSLKSYYNYLIKINQIKFSPLESHKSLKVLKTKQIPFSEKEISETIFSLPDNDNFENSRNRLILEFLYATGIRRAELVSLQLKNVLVHSENIKVHGKRDKERIIPLIKNLLPLIINYLEFRNKIDPNSQSSSFFITQKARPINPSLVYRLTNKYFKSNTSKIKKSPHILRHSFATHLLDNGASINSVKDLMGHSSLASTQVYTHSNLSELKKAYNKSHPRNLD